MLDPAIVEQLPEVTLPAGHQIFRQGDECIKYFLLTDGRVRVFTRSENGKEVLLYRVEQDSICVLTAACMLGGKHYPAEAIAETDLTVRVISKEIFDQLMASSEAFREAILGSFGERLADLIGTIQKLALESVEERLVKFLLMQPNNTIELTHQIIADEIGSAREVVSRHLKRLESQGLIQVNRGQIQLLNRSGLLLLLRIDLNQ